MDTETNPDSDTTSRPPVHECDKYDRLLKKCHDTKLLASATMTTFPLLCHDLNKLISLIESVSSKFREDSQQDLDTDNLEYDNRTMIKWNQSKYTPEALTEHFDEIKDNIKRVEWYEEDARAQGLHVQLKREVSEYWEKGDTLLSFTFNRAAFLSQHLENTCQSFRDNDFECYFTKADPELYYNKVQGYVSILVMFDLLVAYSKENPHLKVALSSGSKCPDNKFAYTSLTSGEGEEYFTLPGQPTKPICVEKTFSTVTLKLTPGENGSENVTSYKLMVFEVGSLKRTEEIKKDKHVTEVQVVGLVSGMEYSFKVQSVSRAGNSPKSSMSDKVLLPVDCKLLAQISVEHVQDQLNLSSGDKTEESDGSELSEEK